MSPSPDIIVVGGGIVGTACAAELARRGATVTLIEAECLGSGATAAGMGHLVVMDDSEAQFALGRLSRDRWDELSDRLPADAEFENCGTLWVAADDQEMAAVRAKETFYAERELAATTLDAAALYEAEPNLRPGLAGALHVPGDSVVYAPCAARALADEATEHGATVLTGRAVTRIDGQRVLLADGTAITAGRVVNAAGDGARHLTPGLPVRPRNGQLAITDRYPGFVSHQLVELGYLKNAHSSGQDSVAFNAQPRPSGQVLLGSSRQFDVTDPAVDHAMLGRMLRRSLDYLPGLADLQIIRCWTGFRAATPDNLPLIGPHPSHEHLWLATGHEGLGVTTSLGTARLLADLMLEGEPPLDPAPFAPARFEFVGGRHA